MKGIEENIDRQHFLDIKNISIIFPTKSVPNKNIFGGNYKNLIKIYSLFFNKKIKIMKLTHFLFHFHLHLILEISSKQSKTQSRFRQLMIQIRK